MKANVITLYEGHHHFGVAALINSLVACGFDGKVSVYYKGELPPWLDGLPRLPDGRFKIRGCILQFRKAQVRRHLGYHKPFAAWAEFEADPECEAVVYADPDVIFVAPWEFFTNWIGMGVALCLDLNFPYLSENHPWRKTWAGLLLRATGEKANASSQYANSGFFGVAREDRGFLFRWMTITETFEAEGGNTTSFNMAQRHHPIVGDQDLMAVALMGGGEKVSMLGQEAMGFNWHNFILVHQIAMPKPWQKIHTWEALKGSPPPPGTALYQKWENDPIAPYSAGRMFWKKIDYRVAQVLSRVWSR